jgi:hypothetical protein
MAATEPGDAAMTFQSHPAVVSRPLERAGAADQYLILGPEGAACWTMDPSVATTFDSMREAMRAAVRLPGALRAFGLPMRRSSWPAEPRSGPAEQR